MAHNILLSVSLKTKIFNSLIFRNKQNETYKLRNALTYNIIYLKIFDIIWIVRFWHWIANNCNSEYSAFHGTWAIRKGRGRSAYGIAIDML